MDNHDNPRFLNLNPSYTGLRNELTFVMMGDWIPIVYYGTEQGFDGGSDPNNRESLWPYMSTEHPLYKFIQLLTKFRSSLGKDWLQLKQVRESTLPFNGALFTLKLLISNFEIGGKKSTTTRELVLHNIALFMSVLINSFHLNSQT